jgi:hypothetical protein
MKTGFASTVTVALALLMTAPPTPAGEALPAPLELHYTLRYGGLTVGQVTKTLTRDADGRYRHRSRSVPMGMARWFTQVEWFEEGQFEIAQGRIRPLRFLEYRVGADKPHRHEAVFDWKDRLIRYASGSRVALPADTQDQGSLVFAFMLHPPTAGKSQDLHVSTGKKLRSYQYIESGQETINTALGPLKTRIIERIIGKPGDEGFRIWLATEHQNLPVRIATRQRGEDTVLDLDSAQGLPGLPGVKR